MCPLRAFHCSSITRTAGLREIFSGTRLDTLSGVTALGRNPIAGRTRNHRWRVLRFLINRYRIVLGLVVLIGITTPQAMSAPRTEPTMSPATSVQLSPPVVGDPAATLLVGAAMIAAAAILRRAEAGSRPRS